MPPPPAPGRHALFLPPAPCAPAARGRALESLAAAAPALRRRGQAVHVYSLRPRDAASARVAAAFRRRGVSALPALLAEGRALSGAAAIEAFYAGARPGPSARGSAPGPRRARDAEGYPGGLPGSVGPAGWAPAPLPESGGAPRHYSEEDHLEAEAAEQLEAFMLDELGGSAGVSIDASGLGYRGEDA
jgi:hypothetical protein